MIAAALLALLGIGLLATGTPRQAGLLFGDRLYRRRRVLLRRAGFGLLAVSLGIALRDPDRARHLIAWIGTIGVEALVVALALTWQTTPRA